MTPRRLDPSIVHARLSVMRGLLDDLAEVDAAGEPHEYLEIDLQKVAMAVPLALSCYRRYMQQVAEFVSRVD